jgi:hypothetical protein
MEIKGKWHDIKTKLVDNCPRIGGGECPAKNHLHILPHGVL